MYNYICLKSKEQYDGELYLYSHYGECERYLQEALRKRKRWNDAEYLSRIIFSVFIKDDIDSDCGFGITTRMSMEKDEVIEVDIDEQKVRYNDKDYSFEEYIKLDL